MFSGKIFCDSIRRQQSPSLFRGTLLSLTEEKHFCQKPQLGDKKGDDVYEFPELRTQAISGTPLLKCHPAPPTDVSPTGSE